MRTRYLIAIIIFLCFGFNKLDAQNDESKDATYIHTYQQEVGNYSPLFYGKEQSKYPYSINGHPYYLSDRYRTSTLYYDNNIYIDVLLRLDSYKDELCVSNPDGSIAVVLNPDLIESAWLEWEELIYYFPENKKNAPEQGYYFKIFDNQCTLYKKNNCILHESTTEGSVINRTFKQSTSYYLDFNNEFYQIKNKRSLLKVLKSHKKELNRFIKNERLNFNENADLFLIQVISEYERLNQ